MKRTLVIAIALVTSLLILIPASAQGPRGGGGRGGIGPAGSNGPGEYGRRMGGGIPTRRILERVLDLSDEQLAEIDTLLEDHRAGVKPIHEEIGALEEQLRADLDGGTADATQVGQIVIDIHGLRGQLRDSQAELREDFRALLTDEQLATLDELGDRRGGRGRRGPRGKGAGGNGNGS